MDITKGTDRSEGRSRKRGRPRDPALDSAILNAARAVLYQDGIRGFSLLEVARRAGVPKSTVYRRWTSKNALLTAALHDLQPPDPPVPDTGSLQGDLVELVRSRIEALVDHQDAMIRIAIEARDEPELLAAVAAEIQRRRHAYDPVFERAVTRGELASDADIDMILDAVVGPLWGRMVSRRPLDVTVAEEVVDQALYGISARLAVDAR